MKPNTHMLPESGIGPRHTIFSSSKTMKSLFQLLRYKYMYHLPAASNLH